MNDSLSMTPLARNLSARTLILLNEDMHAQQRWRVRGAMLLWYRIVVARW